jgi:hypothetical protein
LKLCYFTFQAVPEECLSVAQTDTPLPSNIWTQYDYHAEVPEETEDGKLEKSMKRFLHKKLPE